MGHFRFRLLACLALLAAGSPGAVEALRFQPGRACKLTPGVAHVDSFALKKGDFQELVFDQRGVDIEVEVLDPQGHEVVKVDSMNHTQGPEDVPWIAASTGRYQVRVSSSFAGTYVPGTAIHRRPTPQDRDRAAAAVAYSQGKELKDARKAEAKFQDAARRAGKAKDRFREADALNQLGTLQCAGHLWAECHDSCSLALSIYESLGQRVQLSVVLTHLAMALQNLGDSARAAATYERSVRLAHELGNDSYEALARAGLGRLQLATGKIDQALVNLQEAAKLYHRQPDLSEEAKVLLSCGEAYSKLGELDRALGDQESALKELSKGKDTFWIAWALSVLGDTYREAGQHEQAVSYYLRALRSFHRHEFLEYEAGTSNQLGLAYYRLKNYSEAKNAFLRAVKIFQDRHMMVEEANTWINLGFIDVSLNAIPKAIDSLQRALAINQQQKRLNTEASAYFGLAWAERRRNSLAAARANSARAIRALESLRGANQESEVRALLLSQWQQVYELQVELLMGQHRLEPAVGHDVEAFDVSEQARARTLLESSLGESSSPRALNLRQVQQQVIDPETVLLEYSLGNERSYLWVVTPQEYSSFELPGRAQIASLAREVHDLLSHSHRRQDQERAVRQARTLSQILLGPVARRLGNKRLLIVTPPELQYIPFAALPDLTAEGPPEPDDRWPLPLVVHHEIVSAPSSSVIAALRARARRPEPPNLLALVADPVYELNGARPLAGRFASLPSSRVEAEAIASLAGGETVLKLYDFRANREEVMDQLGAYRILHFAVHGEPNRNNPGRSALVLSAFDRKGQLRDPFLRARDIQDLDLPADLAVLSACGTGLGMEVRGEGLLGLTQAFFSAGTSSVVVSLWDVDDTATTKLMSSFYSGLLKRGLRQSAALREAQIRMWLQPQWNAPSYWAGFIEQGEWR